MFSYSQSWTNSPKRRPEGLMIACSADGTELLAGDGDAVYTSTNSGTTWSNQSTLANVQVLAVSANGGALYVSDSGNLSISTNSGLSWRHLTNRPSYNGLSSCQFITCSADGSKLLVAIGSEQIGAVSSPLFTSADFGNTWSSNTALITNWQCATCSADGSKWFAATYGGAIFTSTNLGVAWTPIFKTNRNWVSLASSVDGTKLAVGSYFNQGLGGIYTSANSGANWRTSPLTQQFGWVSVASSADGSRLVAAADGGEIIFSSTNSGGTWSTNNAPRLHWNTVCLTADGSKAFAAPDPLAGPTATYRSIAAPPEPGITASLPAGNLVLAWPVPSTNFALQSCPDLRLANWQGLANMPALNCSNLQNEVTLSPTNSAEFFRLVAQ